MISSLIGDGMGRQRVFLLHLLDRLRRHTALHTFNLPLANETLSALRAALWRDPTLVGALAETGGVSLLLDQARRTMSNLVARVPAHAGVGSPLERDRIRKVYWRPFREACEILFVLLQLRSTSAGAGLRRGTTSANAFAKAIRQLDARFASWGIEGGWNARVDVQVPESFRRMSQVAFALNGYLSEGTGINLVHVSDADGT